MIIKVPQSLFNLIILAEPYNRELTIYNAAPVISKQNTVTTVYGPFGDYKVQAVPDKDFCKEELKPAYTYVGLKDKE